MPAFDWYQATIPAGVDDVLEALAGIAPGVGLSHSRGMHGYAHTSVLANDEDGPVARVWHGGTHEYPHAVLSGDWAQSGAELIRVAFPVHAVSRVDVREDFSDCGAFDAIQADLLRIASARRLKVGTAGDHLLTMKGRTTYIGSPASGVRLRLYDKREEMLSKLADPECFIHRRALGIPDHLTRLEAQIKPHTREARAEFASIEPVAALGCSPWMREVWKGVLGLDLTPVQVGRGWRQSDDERSYRYMLAQYGGMLRRMRADAGSWPCVGLQIGHDLNGG